ncbi:polysaccharide export protein Wza [Piscirickettsia salmonis]|uniref:Type IV secretion system putative lipoprotein virB7 n=1 Tax=Piscirickettsia salmonis TaxID=1238 RepID=A0A1L6TFY5_PISSA|nr:polysaccharide biosynthesis/export family protein [Piscirickettsia salmonis]AKP74778.2 polysaccharide biosynthesis/export family protein [Piscirickettsia salmonis LF-89 = ATCC VR-1361]ALB21290.1 Polysaccharide export protein [Piscirickettsia salmonis]ALY01536.1 polysaccharide biosynthesis/export family protein [Piscirickettsia salmonis]AMA41049.1 polysaccharide biosynthesis/export family protein [Piscirickettsia salmonis]AOS36238.1 polysaccharide biosynthesis/export family protein [Pisciric
MKKLLFALLLTALLSACSAPGMHMDESSLSSELNGQGKVMQPHVQIIDVQLIQQEMRALQAQLSDARVHYKKPVGFTAKRVGYQYIIGSQDVLRIIVWNHPELNNPASTQSAASIYDVGFTVDQQGNIYYPYIGLAKVAGKTTDQVRAILTKKLATYVKKPQVNVVVMAFNSQNINIIGAVQSPSVVPVTNVPLTVLNAVTKAGGPISCGNNTDAQGSVALCADVQKVAVTRGGKTVYVNLNTLRSPAGSSENWILKNGDVINVPNNNQSRIFVLGAVNKPGPFNMVDGKMTLQQALGNAAGPNMLSNPAYTYVIRNYQNNPQIYLLDAHSADALILASRFALKPQDVVFISNSKIANFNAVLNQILPTLNTATSIKFLTN